MSEARTEMKTSIERAREIVVEWYGCGTWEHVVKCLGDGEGLVQSIAQALDAETEREKILREALEFYVGIADSESGKYMFETAIIDEAFTARPLGTTAIEALNKTKRECV